MKYILVMLFALAAVSAPAQTWNSSCDSTAASERIFRNDVYKLALHRLIGTNNPYKDSVEIPASFRDSISKALYAVYNMPASLLRDTIMYYFGFTDFDTVYNTYPDYEIDSCHIMHDYLDNPSYAYSVKRITLWIKNNGLNPWVNDWVSGNYNNTSNAAINQLVNQYGIAVKLEGQYTNYTSFTLTVARALNTNGLAQRFYDIMSSSPDNTATSYNYIGDGNSIHLDYLSDGMMVTFRNGCGDCPAGCTYGRFWRFKVNTYTDCSISYVKDSFFLLTMPPPNGIYVCERAGGVVTPVYFKNITGELKAGKASVTWEMLTEADVREYIIQQSWSGREFYEAGRLYTTNVSAPSKSYSWQDKEFLTTDMFYRVKALEKNGSIIFSNTVLLHSAKPSGRTMISPNPAINHEVHILFARGFTGGYFVKLYSMDGRLLLTKLLNTGSNVSIPKAIGAGTYFIRLQIGQRDVAQQLIVVQ